MSRPTAAPDAPSDVTPDAVAAPPGQDAPTWWSRTRDRWPEVAVMGGLVLAWWGFVAIFDPNPVVLPGPGEVLSEAVDMVVTGELWEAFLVSMQAMVIGIGISLVFGVLIGLVLGASPLLERISTPYLWALFSTPSIAVVPLLVLYVGVGFELKLWIIISSAIIPMILTVAEGVRTVDPVLLRAARAFCGSRLQTFVHVVMPNTIAYIANGVRVAMSRGFVGVLVVEMLVSTGGLGTEVMRARTSFNTGRTMAYTLALVLLAIVLIGLSRRLEKFASRWRQAVEI